MIESDQKTLTQLSQNKLSWNGNDFDSLKRLVKLGYVKFVTPKMSGKWVVTEAGKDFLKK